MALPRYNATTSLLGGTKLLHKPQENSEMMETNLADKLIPGKAKLVTNRAALGNISNKTVSDPIGKKTLVKPLIRDVPAKPKVVFKSKAPPPLAEKQIEKAPPCPPSPTPMDISLNTSAAIENQDLSFVTQYITLPEHVVDIDSDDKGNPQLVTEYVNEIYAYMRHLEEKFFIRPHFLQGSDITGRMRGVLIDWLVQVHMQFRLLQETLYMTVSIIDRFLQEETVSRSRLQLVGVTAMLIASKFEEQYAPQVSDFNYITDNAYSSEDIKKMERLMLKTLDFSFGRPLHLHFLRRNSKAGEVDAQKHTLAKYLAELTIIDYESAHIPPSCIAAAALCLSIKVLDGSPWTDTLAYYSNYVEEELVDVMRRMACLVLKADTNKLKAIRNKYTTSKMMKISTLPELRSTVIQKLAAGV